MEDLPMFLSKFTPGTYGVWMLVLMAAAHFAREWRLTRKLTSEERQARREGWTAQVEMLQRECRERAEDTRRLRGEYDEYRKLCQVETDQLRDMLQRQEDEISGLKRKHSELSLEMSRMKGNGHGAD